MCALVNMSAIATYICFPTHARCRGARRTPGLCSQISTTSAGVIFHADSRDGTSPSPRWLKRRERDSHTHAVWIHGWIPFWPLKGES